MEATRITLVLLVFCFTANGQDKLRVGFHEQLDEATHQACSIARGEFPDWLQGDFVRQACGSWGDLRPGAEPLTYIEHLFDCVPMIAAFTIREGNVTYSTKYYDTRTMNVWEEYGRDMTKSKVAWSTAFSSFDVDRAANWSSAFPDKYPNEPSVSFWRLGEELTAVTESVNIMLIDTETYDSVGSYPFKDKNIGQPEGTILINNPPHEQVDFDGTFYSAVTAVSFTSQSTGTAKYVIYKVTDGERVPYSEYPIGNFNLALCTGYPNEYPDLAVRSRYMHSFAMTENYIILPTTSYLFDYCNVLAYSESSQEPFFPHGYDWHGDEQSWVLVFNKKTGEFVAKVLTQPFFTTHQFNAFEKDGVIHLDMFTYPNAEVYTKYVFAESLLSPSKPLWTADVERFSITISDWSITRNVIVKTRQGEFSGINNNFNSKEYKYGYFITGVWTEAEPGRIVKMVMATGEQVEWEAPENLFPQEPVFVQRPGATAEDDGVLVIGGFNSDTAKGFMIVLDARDMTLVTEVSAPLLTPIGIHNRFYPAGSLGGAAHPGIPVTSLLGVLAGYLAGYLLL